MTYTPPNGKALPDDNPQYREPRIEAPSPVQDPAEWHACLARRMRLATDMCSLRNIGRRVNTTQETVRRQLRQGNPSAVFLAALCEAFALSPEWLLTGKGPMRPPGQKDVLAKLRQLQRLPSTAVPRVHTNGNGKRRSGAGVI